MKQGDVLMLMDGIAPAVASLIGKAMAPGLARLADAERELAVLKAALADRPDVDELIARAVDKAVAGLPAPPTAEAVAAAMPAPATAEEIAALIPRPADGKSVSIDDIRPLVAEAVAALPAMPTAEEIAAFVPTPQPGKDADPETIRTMVREVAADMIVIPSAEEIASHVKTPTAEEVAALVPPATPGRDADPETIKAAVADEVTRQIAENLPEPPPAIDADALAADVAQRVEGTIKTEVAAAVAALPAIPTAEEVAAAVTVPTAAEIAALVPAPEPGKSVTVADLQPVVDEAVEKAVGRIPTPKDGVGLASALIDRDGELVLTMTDGTTKSLGLVVGKDGAPGFDLDDFEVVDGPESFTLRFVRGDNVKEFTLAKGTLADFYRGVWREGPHKAGSVVTCGGSIWLAKRDTEDRPESSDAWTLIVKKGRDGKDGEAPRGPAKVKL